MICILKMNGSEIEGWIIATDMHDARRQATGAFNQPLAEFLYRMEFAPPLGKNVIQVAGVQYVVLAS